MAPICCLADRNTSTRPIRALLPISPQIGPIPWRTVRSIPENGRRDLPAKTGMRPPRRLCASHPADVLCHDESQPASWRTGHIVPAGLGAMRGNWNPGLASRFPRRHWCREGKSCARGAKVLPFRDVQAFEPPEMIDQIHFGRALDESEDDGATCESPLSSRILLDLTVKTTGATFLGKRIIRKDGQLCPLWG